MLHADIEVAAELPRVTDHDEHSPARLQPRLKSPSSTGADLGDTGEGYKVEPIDQRSDHIGPRCLAELRWLGHHDKPLKGDANFAGSAQTQPR